jgi:hypothetical protein
MVIGRRISLNPSHHTSDFSEPNTKGSAKIITVLENLRIYLHEPELCKFLLDTITKNIKRTK